MNSEAHTRDGLVVLVLIVGTVVAAQQPANPRQQLGASITMFAPEQGGRTAPIDAEAEIVQRARTPGQFQEE